jgi:hypothetical protein
MFMNNFPGIRIFVVTGMAILPLLARTQNNSSPYSILGIGDIDSRDPGRYAASGNTGLARRDMYAYNFSNPAALTALPYKNVHFDLMLRGRTASFLSPGEASPTQAPGDLTVRRMSIAFRITEKTGAALGFRPYSSVNYALVQEDAILDGNSSYFKLIEGSGGINQVYLAFGRQLGKRFSAGVTASYLFGSLQRNTQYINSFVNIVKDENDFYYGGLLQAGMQYYTLEGKKWQHKIGLTATVSTRLNGELSVTYAENGATLKKTIDPAKSFRLPLSAGIGYAATNKQGLTLSVEGQYNRWDYQKVSYANSYTYPSAKVAAGLEYAIGKRSGRVEKGYIGFGVHAENSYLRIEKQKLWDFSLSFGGGLHAFRNLTLHGSVELGRKGNASLEQIRETYTQLVFGLTLREIWLGTKKFGRYD